jgi:hypothetical protein
LKENGNGNGGEVVFVKRLFDLDLDGREGYSRRNTKIREINDLGLTQLLDFNQLNQIETCRSRYLKNQFSIPKFQIYTKHPKAI